VRRPARSGGEASRAAAGCAVARHEFAGALSQITTRAATATPALPADHPGLHSAHWLRRPAWSGGEQLGLRPRAAGWRVTNP